MSSLQVAATTSSARGADARAIAFYLPQYHSIPENDARWGKGFTEWTNVRRARPLLEGHEQPREPGELGYYDLLSPETRAAQATLARGAGIEAFCYWHYWFAGRRLLERPLDEVIRQKEPNFPFCVAWANHSWTAAWVGRPYEMLVEQTYPGREDHERHFDSLLPAFSDPRYVRVGGVPLFVLFRPQLVPDCARVMDLWRELAVRAGLGGLHVLGILDPSIDPNQYGLDGSVEPGTGQLVTLSSAELQRRWQLSRRAQVVLARPSLSLVHQAIARAPRPKGSSTLGRVHDALSRGCLLPLAVKHEEIVARALQQERIASDRYPCVITNWDNTPRMGRWGWVLEGSKPELFGQHLQHAVRLVGRREPDRRLVFVKSWNEWAEGNYLEPDARHGRAFLDAARDVLVAAQVRESLA